MATRTVLIAAASVIVTAAPADGVKCGVTNGCKGEGARKGANNA